MSKGRKKYRRIYQMRTPAKVIPGAITKEDVQAVFDDLLNVQKKAWGPQTIMLTGCLLMSADDDDFRALCLDRNTEWYGPPELIKKITTRAKKLNTIVITRELTPF